MIVSLEIPADTRRRIDADKAMAARAPMALVAGLLTAVAVGAEEVRQKLVAGDLGLTVRHQASGIAASLQGWMIDPSLPMAAIGVPSNTPAAAYARIHEYGGTIVPKNAKMLAIPVSPEAKGRASPRDMEGLRLIRGRNVLMLARVLLKRGRMGPPVPEVHWLLVPSVTLKPTHWLSAGVEASGPVIGDAFSSRFFEVLYG